MYENLISPRRVIVIGAGSGIGAYIAKSIAGQHITLLLHTGSNMNGLEDTAETCRKAGAEVHICLGPLSEPDTFDAIETWVKNDSRKNLKGLVFAAGYALSGCTDTTEDIFVVQAFLDMPVAFHRIYRCVSKQLMRDEGRIVCISAFSAHRTQQYRFAATAPAKAALEAQVRTLASELAPHGITCNAIVPGLIVKDEGGNSSLTENQWQAAINAIPMRRLGKVEEVAAVAELLLSKTAGYVTGQCFHVDGGLML